MLVRHVLSQLSYAPRCREALVPQATGFIISIRSLFVKYKMKNIEDFLRIKLRIETCSFIRSGKTLNKS